MNNNNDRTIELLLDELWGRGERGERKGEKGRVVLQIGMLQTSAAGPSFMPPPGPAAADTVAVRFILWRVKEEEEESPADCTSPTQ